MDLRFTADELAFRDELRAFIGDRLPDDIRERMRLGYAPRKEDTVRWQRILNQRGWAAFNWPKEYGGGGGRAGGGGGRSAGGRAGEPAAGRPGAAAKHNHPRPAAAPAVPN